MCAQGVTGSGSGRRDAESRAAFRAMVQLWRPAGLAPGNYDVFLATASTEGLAALGTEHGFLGSFKLAPLSLTDVEVQIDWEQPIVEKLPN
jgi:hypothetical protein